MTVALGRACPRPGPEPQHAYRLLGLDATVALTARACGGLSHALYEADAGCACSLR